MERFEVRSRLAAPADAIWAWVTTPAGTNDETRPVMRMIVTDRIGFELREGLAVLPGFPRLARAALHRFFRHRHHRLTRRFGAP